MTTGSETIAAAIRDGLHELAEWLREARQATASRETPRMGPVAANTPEPDPVGTPEAAKPSGAKSFPVRVSVDTDEIEEWAGRMADANRHGVAHVLYRALELIEAGSVDWLNPDGQPPTPRPMTVGQLTAEHIGKRVRVQRDDGESQWTVTLGEIGHYPAGTEIGPHGLSEDFPHDTPCEVLDERGLGHRHRAELETLIQAELRRTA